MSDAADLNEFCARNNLVQLPDGRVLDPGGQDVAARRVEDTELYGPGSDRWKVSATYPTQYPTIPTLLRDGDRRAAAGGGSGVKSSAGVKPLVKAPPPAAAALPGEAAGGACADAWRPVAGAGADHGAGDGQPALQLPRRGPDGAHLAGRCSSTGACRGRSHG